MCEDEKIRASVPSNSSPCSFPKAGRANFLVKSGKFVTPDVYPILGPLVKKKGWPS